MIKALADITYRQGRRMVVCVIGGSLLLIGIVLIFLPGPAFVVIPAGLAVLALERGEQQGTETLTVFQCVHGSIPFASSRARSARRAS